MSEGTTYTATVIPVKLSKHPNADALGLWKFEGFYGATQMTQWGVTALGDAEVDTGKLGVFIEPDTAVPIDRPEFAFLKDKAYSVGPYAGFARIKVMKIRQVFSQGLLVPAPEGLKEGDNAFESLGLVHFEPELMEAFLRPNSGGSNSRGVSIDPESIGVAGFVGKYELENLRKFSRTAFVPGEDIAATEKLEGSAMRVRWNAESNDFLVGSRNSWKRQSESSEWWSALMACPELQEACKALPNVVFYGECIGRVKGWKYGLNNKTAFKLYDMREADTNRWLEYDEQQAIAKQFNIPTVPELYRGPFDWERIKELAEGQSALSTVETMCREGCVVRPIKQIGDPTKDHSVYKVKGDTYFSLKKG